MSRCSVKSCNKKLKLTDMECKCGHIYCQIHRLPETHNCEYNFKADKIKLEGCVTPKIIAI